MKFAQCSLLAALIAFAATPGYSSVALVSSDVSPNQYRHHFQVIPFNFFGVYPYEMAFTFTYINPCTGAVPHVGLTDSPNPAELKRTQGEATLTISSKGPIDAFDLTPNQTPKAMTNLECEITVRSYSADLSVSSHQTLADKISFIKKFMTLFSQVQNLDSLAMSVRTLVAQLDPATLGTLLKTVHDNLQALRQGFADAHENEKVEAFDLALDEFKSAICDNPVFRSQNPDICNFEPSGSASDKPLAERIADQLGNLSTLSKDLTRQVSDDVALEVTKAWAYASYAEPTKKASYTSEICSAITTIKSAVKECQ